MNTETEKPASMARWIAAGFLGAFAASIVTVIYTGLMVEGSRSEFDVGFRSVTMTIGQTRRIDLRFDSPQPEESALLIVELPDMLEFAGGGVEATSERGVRLVAGMNVIAVEVRGQMVGSDYLIARVSGTEPIALERVFVTVEPE
jgi:hypothetical protein